MTDLANTLDISEHWVFVLAAMWYYGSPWEDIWLKADKDFDVYFRDGTVPVYVNAYINKARHADVMEA